ncbi:MAG: hypothetical protein KUG75_11065 [Pseudomonadales bacterium]|nr:hypothetical protein [Pseudomonadales bacterium]
MSLYVFNLNDIDLRIYCDNKLVVSDPGFAFIEASKNNFGEQARKQVKQHPQQVNTLYWHRMNLEPLGYTGPKTSNHADLMYQQLQDLLQTADVSKKDELIVLVGSSTSNEQLSLLLGIFQECNITLTGLVDRSVALLSMHRTYAQNLVLDLSLHSLSMTEISSTQINEQQALQKSGNVELSELGFLNLMDAWLAIIADRFISETRFDPLRIADTEQQVFDQVYDWINSLPRSKLLNIEVHYQNVSRNIEINETVLIEKARQRYDLIIGQLGDKKNIWLTEPTNILPGFLMALGQAGHTVLLLDGLTPYQAVFAQLPDIVSAVDQIQFVTALKAGRPSQTKEPPSSGQSASNTATHVLCQGCAINLVHYPTIGPEFFSHFEVKLPGQPSEYPILITQKSGRLEIEVPPESTWSINGQRIDITQTVYPGDTIKLKDGELEFIRVIEDGT